MEPDLAKHLELLERDARYRVDAVLKETGCERTERVSSVEADGAVSGPFIRKRFARDQGIGGAYEKLAAACETGAAFKHLPHVYDCHDAGEERVVVMELVPGETLDAVVKRTGPGSALAIDVGLRLTDALAELHGAFDPPLIHRDLKPSNIMLAQDSLHLIDFGIARTFSLGARADTVRFGTRDYAPPEQYGFGQTDVRSDIYALGAVLYFCAKGKAPSPSSRESRFRGEGVFEPLREVIAQAVSLDPDRRYDSARMMRRALEKVAAAYFGGTAAARRAMRASRGAALAASGSRGTAPHPPVDVSRKVVSAASGSAASRQAASLSSRTVAPMASAPEDAAPVAAKPLRADLKRTVAPLREAASRVLSAIPLGIGVAWNVMLGAVFALFVAVFVGLVWSPDPSLAVASWPRWCRFAAYGLLVFCVFGPMLYLASDRRLPRRWFPRVFRASCLREAAVLLVVAFAAIVAAFAIAIVGTGAIA